MNPLIKQSAEIIYTLCSTRTKTNFMRKIIISYLVCHMEKYHKQDVAPIEKENERDENYEASNPQIDSEKNPDDDITPFKNILNEMYAKDCSKKIKAVAFSISLRCLSLTVRISLSVGTSAQILCGY